MMSCIVAQQMSFTTVLWYTNGWRGMQMFLLLRSLLPATDALSTNIAKLIKYSSTILCGYVIGRVLISAVCF